MFERLHHQRLAQVLLALDGPLLRENHCLFGGGTAMALRYGEYRESVDLDFPVSDVGSYGRRFVRYGECCLEESEYSPAFAGQAQDELLSFYVNT